MRPTWQGNLKLALVLIPVRAYPAARVKTLAMNQLHDECKARVRLKRRCTSCERDLERDDIVRGYEYAKDQYVLIDESDLAKMQLPSLRALDIVQFVEESEIDPLCYHGSYYLAPAGEVAAGPFYTIHEAMQAAKRVAIAEVVLGGKEKVVAIRPADGVFVMSFLHYADEIRPISDIEDLPGKVEPKAAEVAMARQLLASYARPFELSAFEDDYRKRFLQIVESKSRGEEVVTPPSVEPKRVVDLMEALRSSLSRVESDPGAADEGDPGGGPDPTEERRAS